MPRGNDFSEINPSETVTLTWDFGTELESGVTLLNPTTSCAVVAGSDSSPSSRLIGDPVIGTSPSSGQASQAVMQQVSTMIGGVLYLLSAIAQTSDNQVVEVYAHAYCATPA